MYVVDSSAAEVLDWAVEWAPVIELHHYVFDSPGGATSVELIARNAINCGIVEAPAAARGRGTLREVPIDAVCTVKVGGKVVGAQPLSVLPGGPGGTVSWLKGELEAQARVGDAAIMRRPGAVLLTSSPAGLYPVAPGMGVEVVCVGGRVCCTVEAGPAAGAGEP